MGWKQWQRSYNRQKALVKEMERRMETLREESGAGDSAGHYWVCSGELLGFVDDGDRDPPREARGWGRWSGVGM